MSQSKILPISLCFLILLALLTACGGSAATQQATSVQSTPAPSIQLKPCKLGDIAAQCGTFTVYENRATQSGPTIELHLAVIKAQSGQPAPDPIFYLAGGPGASAVGDASYALRVLKSASQQRDIVLVDQRGTGGSNLMTCPRSVEEANALIPLDDTMIQNLRDCLSHLNGDPAAYTTAWSMDDLDDVRAALGYDQINLYGESYGPTAEQVYLQRHGEHVRTMTLEGVTLLDVPMFERLPRSTQEALDLVLTRCENDSACKVAYPNIRAELAAVLDRVAKQPIELPLIDPHTNQKVLLNYDMLVEGLHGLLIDTPTAVLLPRLVQQLYNGKLDELAQMIAPSFASNAPAPVWKIMNLTILCFEDWAKMRPDETAQISQGSFMSYENVRHYTVPEKICALMPRPRPVALHQPLTTSSVPVLIIIDQADPQNPLENVAGAKEHYPNSLTVVAPGQGHGYLGFGCRNTFISAFIERGTTDGLDTSCLQKEPLPPFQ